MILNLQWLNKLFDFFLPHSCVLCGDICVRDVDLCIDCEQELPLIKYACHHCAAPLFNDATIICGACLRKKPPFDCAFALFHYQDEIKKLLTDLKFHQQLVNAKLLGILMVKQLKQKDCYLKESKPEYIIPIPLHSKRLKERGFNQSVEIARPIAKAFNIPIDCYSCKRIKYTEAQSSIPAKDRKSNVHNAFYVKDNFKPNYVAIVDDVMTTGYTVSEFAMTLRRNGVKKIDVWCCAKTM